MRGRRPFALLAWTIAAIGAAAWPPLASGADPRAASIAARTWHRAHGHEILAELGSLVSLPNVASDAANIRRNAERLLAMLEQRGIAARLLEVPGAPPAVLGERRVPGARKTVVFYAHYDGQPAPPAEWASDPWTPIVRAGRLEDGADEVPAGELALPLDRWAPRDGVGPDDWRLYARSASDDKGPIVGMLAALDALDDAGIQPAVNLKFFFEGEEEAGSEHLADLLRRYSELLAADLWLFCDGPVHPSGRGQVVFGVRGVMGLELEVYGPLRALHSGHYGNWAPNPAARLAELLAGLRDGEGRILVPGFYEDVRPADEAERTAVAALPDPDEALRLELGIGASEAGNARLAERILLPALNIRGLAAGAVGGEAQNAVPTSARASIDVRLVPDQQPQRVRELVEAHLRRQGWHLVAEAPDLATRRAHSRIARLAWDGGYPAYRVPLGLPVSRAVAAAVSRAYGEPVLEVPTLGGSLPLDRFAAVLGVPLVVVPTVNADNSQHAPDENLRLGNLWRGIEIYASLMAGLGEGW